jgi:hypothetical protein
VPAQGYDHDVQGSRRRRPARIAGLEVAGFALLALVGELTGRNITFRLDDAVVVRPRAAPMAAYYPFVLAGIRLAAALGLAWIVWRLLRAHATAALGETVLRAVGHRRLGAPRLRLKLDPRLWLAAFGATSLWYLVQSDVERLSEGRWPLLAPWLHTYSLPVFAVLSVVLALGWGAVRNWLHELERYASDVFALVCRALRRDGALPVRPGRPCDDRAPRHLFGVVFESRPPPFPA